MAMAGTRLVRNVLFFLLGSCLMGLIVFLSSNIRRSSATVPALLETTPVPHGSDAADDVCIWVHPTDPELSLVIGTDKGGGIGVYDLSGEELQYLNCGQMNNIDIRYNFPLKNHRIPILMASNRSSKAVDFFTISGKSRRMKKITGFPLTFEPYGCCLYFSPKKHLYYAFVTSHTGMIQQWQLGKDPNGDLDLTWVRTWQLATKAEGCVADDGLGFLYVSEEGVGVWKFFADPGMNDSWRRLVCSADRFSGLRPDLEGLTLYYRSDGSGYLIVSSQGNNRFAVFRRETDNDYIASFEIGGGKIDRVTHTDGIDVLNLSLGSRFPTGLFVAQDDHNDGNQNFKLIRWGDIASALGEAVTVDTSFDPREVGKHPSSKDQSAHDRPIMNARRH
jgi:3-phytase